MDKIIFDKGFTSEEQHKIAKYIEELKSKKIQAEIEETEQSIDNNKIKGFTEREFEVLHKFMYQYELVREENTRLYQKLRELQSGRI